MKKLLSVIIAAVMLLGTFTTGVLGFSFHADQRLILDDSFSLGDVNDDGVVNAKDAYYMAANISGLSNFEMNLNAADFNANGEFDTKDIFFQKMCLAGMATPKDYGDELPVYKLTIGGNDIEKYSIVLPEGSTDKDNIWFAYLNMKEYIRRATGVELEMSFDTATTEKAIYFHNVSMDTEDGKALGYEGYRYSVTDGNLNIYGSYRGNMYAVFEICEEYLGMRFFSGSETFAYKHRAADIPEGISREHVPELEFRYARHTFGKTGAPIHFFANRLNGSQLNGYDDAFYGTKTGPFYSNAHSFYEYWKMGTGTMPTDENMTYIEKLNAKFASGTFPDPYTWQPCATNDEVYKMLFDGMLECNAMRNLWNPTENVIYYEEGLTVFSFSICDNQCYHTCRNCNAISQGNKRLGTEPEGYSGLYLQLYNRAAEDVQEYYPGIHLYGIVYAKDFPKTIKPHEKLIILYCGTGCDNHILGKEECYEEGGTLDGSSNKADLYALDYWGNLCRETGAKLWFWIYPVTYHYYLSCCPNVFNIYWNMKWLREEAGVSGFFYEGGGTIYNFETLKEWIAVKFMWDPDMTWEECKAHIMEYLYINYGDGGEELYRYIEMQTEAGDQCGTCFINNFDRPGDMYSYEYLAEHYEEMRGLLLTAREKAKNDDQRYRIDTLIVCCDFMGLSSVHTDWYVNGNNVELYKERYDWMYNFIVDNEMVIFSSDLYLLPTEIDYEENPMIQYYAGGSRREGVYP